MDVLLVKKDTSMALTCVIRICNVTLIFKMLK